MIVKSILFYVMLGRAFLEKLRKKIMGKTFTLHKVRLIAGCALIGSVLTGVAFGWLDLSFDPRAIGAGVGALAGTLKAIHVI